MKSFIVLLVIQLCLIKTSKAQEGLGFPSTRIHREHFQCVDTIIGDKPTIVQNNDNSVIWYVLDSDRICFLIVVRPGLLNDLITIYNDNYKLTEEGVWIDSTDDVKAKLELKFFNDIGECIVINQIH